MKSTLAVVLLVALGWGCGGGAESKPNPRPEPRADPQTAAPSVPAPKKIEPDHIQVAHILISFAGRRTAATRSRADAEKLATDVLARVKKGEDFDRLMRDFSDDTGAGVYRMSNRGVRSEEGEMPRLDMVPAFGDVGFQLDVGEIGFSTFSADKSPFGWHIIKRLK
ncbi:MAG TPA: peptidylprolyl isomerase [Planctomycetota bacterium]|nr:peptidylprolyl isomerase [Planctomycetota bacterium]